MTTRIDASFPKSSKSGAKVLGRSAATGRLVLAPATRPDRTVATAVETPSKGSAAAETQHGRARSR